MDEVKSILAKAVEKFGRIDIVVNNAGYVSRLLLHLKKHIVINLNQAVLGEVEVCPLDAARDQFEVMFWGAVYISKEVNCCIETNIHMLSRLLLVPVRRFGFSARSILQGQVATFSTSAVPEGILPSPQLLIMMLPSLVILFQS